MKSSESDLSKSAIWHVKWSVNQLFSKSELIKKKMSHTSEWTAGFTQHTMDMPQIIVKFIVPACVWEHEIERQRQSKRVKERQSCYPVVIWQMFVLVPKGTWYFHVLGRQDAAFYSVCLGNKLSWQRFRSSNETDESWRTSWDVRMRGKPLFRLSDDDLSVYKFAHVSVSLFCKSII